MEKKVEDLMIKECLRTVHVTWMVVGLSTTGLCKRTMTSPSSFCTCLWSTPWAGGLMSVEEARHILAGRHQAIIEMNNGCIFRWEREEEMTSGFKLRCQKIVTTESIQKKNSTNAEKRFFDLKIIKWNCHNQLTALMFPFFPPQTARTTVPKLWARGKEPKTREPVCPECS